MAKGNFGLQVLEGDLIGASTDALAVYHQTAGMIAVHMDVTDPGRVHWLAAALGTISVYDRVLALLDAARDLPGMGMSAADAGWKRCGEVKLHQNMAKVHRTHRYWPTAPQVGRPAR